jgi:hypothetical protein
MLFWGRETTEGIVAARFPTGRGCIPCLSALAGSTAAVERFGQRLGALLATLGLRALLGIGLNDRAELLRLVPGASFLVSSPFPSRPECAACS